METTGPQHTTSVAAAVPFVLDDEQRAVVENRHRRLRVLAGPGTGKTTTLVETVVDRVASGVRAEEIMVLTFSRRAAADLTGRLARRLRTVLRDPMVRTLHSYAYAVVRRDALLRGEPLPRMLGAGESDRVVRDLLAGHAQDGTGGWPESVRPALRTAGFAEQARDVLMRSAERGIGPQRLIAAGERTGRADWVAVGRLAAEYRQVADLRQGSSGLGAALDQAELTAAAVAVLRADDLALAAERRRCRRLFVDEYQDVDPAQAALVELLAGGADEFVVVGDGDQSIYGFRGSESAALRDITVDATFTLTRSRRLPAELVTATRRVAALLPGDAAHRELRAESPAESPTAAGDLEVRVLPTAAQEATWVADRLRRSHLLEGLPWHRMGVLLRSPAAGLAALERACGAAGVPLRVIGSDRPIAEDPMVSALLLVLQAGVSPVLTAEAAQDLLLSPVGGMDPMGLRRVRRALRRAAPDAGPSGDQLAAALLAPGLPAAVPEDLAPALEAVRTLLVISREGAHSPDGRDLLWQLWQQGGWEADLLERSRRGGRAGERADRILDSMIEMVSLADDLAERLPGAGVPALIDLVRGQRIPGDEGTWADRGVDAVAVMSVHSAKGLEWDLVAVVGVQDETWPDLRRRTTLLQADELLAEAGRVRRRDAPDRQLIEERRLFYVAATRARRTLICTAVDDEEHTPSRFLTELTGRPSLPVEPAPGSRAGSRRLHLVDLVADLRRAVTDPGDPARARAAAGHLARLAAAGVRGAHPRDWYGLPEPSTMDPVAPPGAVVTLSPSTVENMTRCPLQVLLERRGGRAPAGEAQLEGTAVHALAQGLGTGMSAEDLAAEVEAHLDGLDQLPGWQRERLRRVLLTMVSAARIWAGEPGREFVGSEVPIDVTVPAERPGDRPVRITGRMDWVSRDTGGRWVIADFKTSATKATKAEAEANPQLATYQLVVRLSGRAEPGGAELVYLRDGQPAVRSQPALSDEGARELADRIRAVAEDLAGSGALARVNQRCQICPVRSACPAHPGGRQVTQ